ncbi:MAG: adenylate/guanylate cyclase domain-containing protein [Parachlamydiaceae bacterium]|nr:adenylate/guanylate cyclase domain-containing protein [Parachlamydiaceae bacterium]
MKEKLKAILIVDPNPIQRLILQKILHESNFKTINAENEEQAFDILTNKEIDLIISDVSLPILDGYIFCHKIKSNPRLWHIPLILCTVFSSAEDLMRGIEANADSYITRPYNKDHLIQLIRDLLKIPLHTPSKEKEEIVFGSKSYSISTSRQYILNFLLETYSNIHQQHKELLALREELQKANEELESIHREQKQLLLNMFPESVANELIRDGKVEPLRFEGTSVMFIDFVGFSKSATILSPHQLIQVLNYYFEEFDKIIDIYQMERIKTIGDGYMCVAGVPTEDNSHAVHCVMAALEIQKFIKKSKRKSKEKFGVTWDARIGIHSGPIVAGVIGKKRFAYDIWGDTVNLAKRMETQGAAKEINISSATYQLIKDDFIVEDRGNLPIHNKGAVETYMEMYFVKDKK